MTVRTRRRFLTDLAIAGAGLTIVPRHVLGRGFTAPSDLLNVAAVGVVAAWATIVLCQLRFYHRTKAGTMQRPNFRMPFTPYSGYVTLAFLLGVLVLMALDPEKGPWVIAALIAAVPALIGGWFLVRDRAHAARLDEPEADVPELAQE